MKTCKTCAFRGGDVARYKGNMVYDHKTSPNIKIMTSECWKEQKKYYKPKAPGPQLKIFLSICAHK